LLPQNLNIDREEAQALVYHM
jgi:dsDNA-specific endonuclease/ATPase MutS2